MSSERMILGNNCIFNGDPKVTGLNRNVLVVGGTGSGKTVSFVEPALMESLRVKNPNNKVVILTKRDLADKYIPLYKAAGFKVYDLDFSNPERGNCCYNPLAYIKSEEDIAENSRANVMSNERKEHSTADPFWDDSSEQLLSAETAGTMMIKDNPTWADVLDLHFSLKIEESGCGITTSLDPMFRKIEKAAPDCYAITCWRTFKEAAPKTAKSIYVSMNPTLRAYTTSIRNSIRINRQLTLTSLQKKNQSFSLLRVLLKRHFMGWRISLYLRRFLNCSRLQMKQKQERCLSQWISFLTTLPPVQK